MTIDDPIEAAKPFRLDPTSVDRPVVFEVLVELDGCGYRYRIEADRYRVVRELLDFQDAAPRSGWVTLIDRSAGQDRCDLHWRVGSTARRHRLVEDTRDNALILSRAAERNVELVLPLYRWFQDGVCHIQAGRGPGSDYPAIARLAEEASQDTELMQRIAALLRDADTGITAVDTSVINLDRTSCVGEGLDQLADDERQRVTLLLEEVSRIASRGEELEDLRLYRFEFRRAAGTAADEVAWDMSSESHGTIRYLRLLGELMLRLAKGRLLAIDELHTALHPELAGRLLQLVHGPEFARAGAQLLFTTHDATLMNSELLRRDQIVLVNKKPDGTSEVYSLWEFEDLPRREERWSRHYLAGRFGGLPVFGPRLADVEQSEEPTPVDRPGREQSRAG